ncbi:hypothetical protein P43SY_001558 [Pythium insidiosum]|uniref:Uncharacterized protein n=1 Tax=Pythium insidiosum TaxID=114742 RepID=A0AAD5Q847_PYTIN|nr:hypothetical protein P43SY_001558 [Pythium insidiosum]
MGGGPANADVVRSSCILTFPADTGVEPVPVDAWYLHAVGRTFLRRLARDRIGDAAKISLLMQRVDPTTQQRKYISVGTDDVLRDALKETFEHPERVLVLHIIALDKVAGQRTVRVRREANPYVSPEPVEPFALVFPTLSVPDVAIDQSASAFLGMSRSVMADFGKTGGRSSVYLDDSKRLSHSVSSIDKRHSFAQDEIAAQSTVTKPCSSDRIPVATTTQVATDQTDVNDFAAAGAKLISADDESDVPLARVVGRPDAEAARIPSDYVMLELNNGAGLDDVPVPANSSSTFFISPNWHLQAEELSASTRLSSVSSATSSLTWAPTSSTPSSSSSTSETRMEDSFVMLDRDP